MGYVLSASSFLVLFLVTYYSYQKYTHIYVALFFAIFFFIFYDFFFGHFQVKQEEMVNDRY